MILFFVFKFDIDSREWIEIKSFGKKECAQNYIGILSRDSDDLFCIEARVCAGSVYAGVV